MRNKHKPSLWFRLFGEGAFFKWLIVGGLVMQALCWSAVMLIVAHFLAKYW